MENNLNLTNEIEEVVSMNDVTQSSNGSLKKLAISGVGALLCGLAYKKVLKPMLDNKLGMPERNVDVIENEESIDE